MPTESLAHVAGDDDVDVVLVGLLAQLRAHVHADDGADAGVGELLHDLLGTLGAAGHVDLDLAGALARGLLLPMYGPAPFCAAMRYSGTSSSAFCTSSMSLRLALGEVLVQVLHDQVVGGRVRREERDAEQARDVDRLVVVDGHEAALAPRPCARR